MRLDAQLRDEVGQHLLVGPLVRHRVRVRVRVGVGVGVRALTLTLTLTLSLSLSLSLTLTFDDVRVREDCGVHERRHAVRVALVHLVGG